MLSILRSCGYSEIISMLDCGIMWLVGIALALLIVQTDELVRMLIDLKRFSSGLWANDLNKMTGE